MKKIAIYGKGGIGKSTTVSNISAAMAEMGKTVLQIGCDPKADSTRNLTGGKNIPTVLDILRDQGDAELEDFVVKSSTGVLCVEAGGPVPGIGCAGRGIITAFEKLEELEAYDTYRPDVVLYDVLGDVVCGGFAMPIRGGYADEVCIVTSGEMMSLYAASNIAHAVKSFGSRGYASLRGLILNSKNIELEEELVKKAASEIDAPILYRLPRDGAVQQAEAEGKTVIEALPDSDMAEHYRSLARLLLEGGLEDE
ncbi:nitrogenase subunit nifH [Lacrimispora xylanolytica]|uniref:nitrogenase n=1 Tax=Lacrimispora xylanolytica TaxID=29375 RepID=A0ABY7A701_9FIRM|nr:MULTISPECIES: nitrogenase iron protein NifH [Clostridia]MBS5956863.1 AAA family ATPase [Clostridiales bacterium]WAJ22234.1 nitrogenase iron protein NifH [Lacrimispora xylanolytica]